MLNMSCIGIYGVVYNGRMTGSSRFRGLGLDGLGRGIDVDGRPET